jgi:uncharacterized tellurite resistance protein B-like protein
MLDVLRSVFRQFMVEEGNGAHDTLPVQLAMAALLCEVSRADYVRNEQEEQAKIRLLMQMFLLDHAAATALLLQAEQKSQQAVSLFDFTNALRSLTQEQRFQLIRSMWAVAYADGTVAPEEEAVIRQVADLIYIDHATFIRAKLQAAEQTAV